MIELSTIVNEDNAIGAIIMAVFSALVRYIDLKRISKGKPPLFTFKR